MLPEDACEISYEGLSVKTGFSKFDKMLSEFLPGLALLGLPRLASASLALPAPRNNSPAAFGGRAARSAAAVVAGAGKASETDARRGEPSKARPGAYNSCVWRLAHLETFSEKYTLKKTTFLDVFLRGIRYRDLIRFVIWSRMH